MCPRPPIKHWQNLSLTFDLGCPSTTCTYANNLCSDMVVGTKVQWQNITKNHTPLMFMSTWYCTLKSKNRKINCPDVSLSSTPPTDFNKAGYSELSFTYNQDQDLFPDPKVQGKRHTRPLGKPYCTDSELGGILVYPSLPVAFLCMGNLEFGRVWNVSSAWAMHSGEPYYVYIQSLSISCTSSDLCPTREVTFYLSTSVFLPWARVTTPGASALHCDPKCIAPTLYSAFCRCGVCKSPMG